MDGVEVRTLTDGGQPAEQTANALAAFMRRRAADARDRDLRLQAAAGARRDRLRRAVAAPSGTSPSASPTTSTTRRPCPSRRRRRRIPTALEALPVPDRRHPGRPRPHAPQVRRPRRRLGLDGVDELDGGLVDARGERHRHRRLAGARRRATATTSSSSGRSRRSPIAARSTPLRWTGIARLVLSRAAARSSRTGSRSAIGSAQRRIRIASPVIRSAPILRDARPGRVRREGRPCGGRGRHADRRGALRSGTRTSKRRGTRTRKAPLLRATLTARAVLRARSRRRTRRARCTTTCTRR